MGLPVVAFNVGGVPEIVLHGETGFLAEDKDVRSLITYVEKLLDDEVIWNSFSSRARKHVEEMFDLRKQNQKLEALYHHISTNFQINKKEFAQ